MKHLVLLFGLSVGAFLFQGCTTSGGSASAKPSGSAATPTAKPGAPASSFQETARATRAGGSEITPYPFTTCAVNRKDLEGSPKYRRVYKNQEVHFCCTPCVNAFDTNPEPYMPRIIAAAAAKERGQEVNSGW